MYENNSLKYYPINRWISRFQEMSLQKKDAAVQMDNDGNIKVVQKQSEPTCDTTGEAYETWINKLFEAAQRAVPKGYAQVTLGQLVVADRELFVRLADRLEGQLQKPIGAEKPMDAALRELSDSHDINQFLQPLAEGQLQKPIGAEKPMDAALRELSDSHDINQFLQPLASPPPPPHPNKRPLKDPPSGQWLSDAREHFGPFCRPHYF
eukprot:s13059_g1.t1